MEIKIGHVYYTEVGLFRAEKDARDEWCGRISFQKKHLKKSTHPSGTRLSSSTMYI